MLTAFVKLYRCDVGYSGLSCHPQMLATELKEDFEDDLSSRKWFSMSGGSLSKACGYLATGLGLYFSKVQYSTLLLYKLAVR